MLGEFKNKVKNALLYVLSVIPKKDSYGEVFRGKGKWADINISVDDENFGAALYYNVKKTNIDNYIELQFDKAGENAGWIALEPYDMRLNISFADGGNANDGDSINPLPLLTGRIAKELSNTESRLGIGVSFPTAALHVKGKLRIDDSSITTTTSNTATAGTATLPSNPIMFLIVNINGTDYKIPLYGV